MRFPAKNARIGIMQFIPVFLLSAWFLVSYPEAGTWVLLAYFAYLTIRMR